MLILTLNPGEAITLDTIDGAAKVIRQKTNVFALDLPDTVQVVRSGVTSTKRNPLRDMPQLLLEVADAINAGKDIGAFTLIRINELCQILRSNQC